MNADPLGTGELDPLFAPLAREPHWGLAVSGGADSMALMHLADRWREGRGGEGPRISVLSVDHGLRDGSAGEAAFVARAARGLGLDCAVLKWTGEKPKTRIQEAARAARYDLMTAYARAHGVSCLVTAHHLGDQAETLLMRLKRGSGIDGLAAMPALGAWAGFPVYRPLLDIPGARLRASLRAAGAEWIEDPGNRDERFERVRLRKAMTALENMGYSAEKLAGTARRMRRASEALDAGARDFLQSHARMHEAGYCELARDAWAALPEEIAIRALKMALGPVGGAGAAPSLSRLERLAEVLREGAPGAKTLAGCRIVPREEEILVMREPGRKGLGQLVLRPGEQAVWDRRVHVASGKDAGSPVTVSALGRDGLGEVRARLGEPLSLPSGAGQTVAAFRADGRLLCAPQLGFHAARRSGEAGRSRKALYTARFLGETALAPAGNH